MLPSLTAALVTIPDWTAMLVNIGYHGPTFHTDSDVLCSRKIPVLNILRYLGIDSLLLLLPGPLPELSKKAREVVDAGEMGDVIAPSSWQEDEGWNSFERDIRGAMGW